MLNPECLLGGDCCAVAILSAQEDFRSARSRLQEIVEEAGHIFLLYPKSHCELNWIEYYWGRCNYFTRKHCNYTLAGTVAHTSSLSFPLFPLSFHPRSIFFYFPLLSFLQLALPLRPLDTRKHPSEGDRRTEARRQKRRTSQHRKRRNWGDEDAKETGAQKCK